MTFKNKERVLNTDNGTPDTRNIYKATLREQIATMIFVRWEWKVSLECFKKKKILQLYQN